MAYRLPKMEPDPPPPEGNLLITEEEFEQLRCAHQAEVDAHFAHKSLQKEILDRYGKPEVSSTRMELVRDCGTREVSEEEVTHEYWGFRGREIVKFTSIY